MIEINGVQNVQRALDDIAGRVNGELPRVLTDIGMDLLGKSKVLAPIDTGDLRGTGFTQLEDKTVVIGFTTPYALKQHEDLTCNHPKGGQAKYLEQPLNQNRTRYINLIKDTVERSV